MSWWLVDHGNLVLLVLGLAGFVLAAIYWQNRRVKTLIAIGGILVLVVLFWFMTRLVITDRKQLELNVYGMANATLEKRPDMLRTYLSQDFTYQSLRRTDVAEKVVGAALTYRVTGFYISDFQVEEVSRKEGRARVSFRLRIDAESGVRPFLCKAEFVLETDRWGLSKFDLYNPFVNQDEPFQFHLP